MSEPLQTELMATALPQAEAASVVSEPSVQAAAPRAKRAKVDRVYSHDGVFTVFRNLLEMIVVAIFIVTFAVQPSRIPSESMVPTLKVGDFLLVDKQVFAPSGWLDRLMLPPGKIRRGDMIVFHYPVDPDVTLVKRVVGVPGDRLHLHLGRVYIDDVEMYEPYAIYTKSRANNYRDEFPSQRVLPDDNVDTRWWLALRKTPPGGDLVVPQGEYFVLGDNRNDSEDSRYWGFVPQDAVIGRPLLVYFTEQAEDATGAMNHLRAEWHSFHVPR